MMGGIGPRNRCALAQIGSNDCIEHILPRKRREHHNDDGINEALN